MWVWSQVMDWSQLFWGLGNMLSYCQTFIHLFYYSAGQVNKNILIAYSVLSNEVSGTTVWTWNFCCDIMPKQPCQVSDSENHHCLGSPFCSKLDLLDIDTRSGLLRPCGHCNLKIWLPILGPSSVGRYSSIPINSSFFFLSSSPLCPKVLADLQVNLLGFWPSQHL